MAQETCEKLFNCTAESAGSANIPDAIAQRLAAEAQRHTEATISQSLEANNQYFNEAREKQEKQQRRQRQEIFQVEDSVIEKRDALIESLERRLTQKTESNRLFTISWEVV